LETARRAGALSLRVDKIVWFVVIPAIWIILGMSSPVVYENPLPYLIDLWFVMAIATWIARRPYVGGMLIWRRVVVALWILYILSLAGQGTG
jgi:hypothetical protein